MIVLHFYTDTEGPARENMNAKLWDGRSAEKNTDRTVPSCECFPGGDMADHPSNFSRQYTNFNIRKHSAIMTNRYEIFISGLLKGQ